MWKKVVVSVDPIQPEPAVMARFANPSAFPCYAAEWAVVNYFERQLECPNYLSIRNEYFDRGGGFNFLFLKYDLRSCPEMLQVDALLSAEDNPYWFVSQIPHWLLGERDPRQARLIGRANNGFPDETLVVFLSRVFIKGESRHGET